MPRRVALLCSVAVLAAVVAGSARADGDPASDTLIYQNAFFPYPAPSKDAQSALTQAVKDAYSAGYRLKVAVVAGPSDLGAIPSLFDRPTQYARFLGQELLSLYVGPLLIVMPSGFGIYDGGRSTAAEAHVLAALPAPGTNKPDDLTRVATDAVTRLVKARALNSKDILPPLVSAVSATLTNGTLRVVYYIADDSGRAAPQIFVVSSGRQVLAVRKPMSATNVTRPVQTDIAVHVRLDRKHLLICAAGVDPSGNRSRRSCVPLRR